MHGEDSTAHFSPMDRPDRARVTQCWVMEKIRVLFPWPVKCYLNRLLRQDQASSILFFNCLSFKLIKIGDNAKSKKDYQVQVSMLEIYNEVVKDLFNVKSFTKQGLRVRQVKNMGFYCEGLTKKNVDSYAEIDQFLAEGNRNRTIAATNMNATSSRAHTIFFILFQQKSPNSAGQMMTKSSQIALVDLAGSERADSTGATGDRLKEGAAINQSLSSLGNCIKGWVTQVLAFFRWTNMVKVKKSRNKFRQFIYSLFKLSQTSSFYQLRCTPQTDSFGRQSRRQKDGGSFSWFKTDNAPEECARRQLKDNHDRRPLTRRHQLRRDTEHVAFCRSSKNDQNESRGKWIANGEVDSGIAWRNRAAEAYSATDDDNRIEWRGIMSWKFELFFLLFSNLSIINSIERNAPKWNANWRNQWFFYFGHQIEAAQQLLSENGMWVWNGHFVLSRLIVTTTRVFSQRIWTVCR